MMIMATSENSVNNVNNCKVKAYKQSLYINKEKSYIGACNPLDGKM